MKLLADGRLLVVLFTVTVVSLVVAGLVVIGPPSRQRERRLDDERERHLKAISSAVDVYRSRNSALPKALNELAQASDAPLQLEDPETGRPYEYRVITPNSYELCARFARQSDEREHVWTHGAGQQCFTLQPRPKDGAKRPEPAAGISIPEPTPSSAPHSKCIECSALGFSSCFRRTL
jgi:hypothetical protein